MVETGGLENVLEEIGLNVFNRLGRYWLGQFGMIRAGSVRNWATIRATSSARQNALSLGSVLAADSPRVPRSLNWSIWRGEKPYLRNP